jgi:UDP-2,4-diacetamido-2,4,6-trideoxy-beta-L-altropyranose hydrolase
MRCLALAQAWQDAGGTVAFACAELPESLAQRLESEHVALHRFEAAPASRREAHDIQETLRIANVTRPQWLILDGYNFGPDFQLALRDSRWRLLFIDDDWRHDRYHVDVLLNQNAGASATFYSHRSAGARLLVGCQYVLLRREFRVQPQPAIKDCQRVASVLLTLGGADQKNDTARLLKICGSCLPLDCQVHVLVGPANPHVNSLRERSKTSSVTPIGRGDNWPGFVLHVAPPSVPEIMAACDLAITAAGSSVYELGFLGIPMLLVVTAENQRAIAAALDSLGAAVWIDKSSVHSAQGVARAIRSFIQDSSTRAGCARKFQTLVDGRGAARVVDVLSGKDGTG